jgi:hypothetical protein
VLRIQKSADFLESLLFDDMEFIPSSGVRCSILQGIGNIEAGVVLAELML